MNNTVSSSTTSSSSSSLSSSSSAPNFRKDPQHGTIPVVRLETGSTVLPVGHSMYLHTAHRDNNVSKPNVDELTALKEMGKGLKSSLQSFLPQIATANKELQKRIELEGNNAGVDIMNISPDTPKYIEMNVAFTELEEGAVLEGDDDTNEHTNHHSSSSSTNKKKKKLILPNTAPNNIASSSRTKPLIQVLQDTRIGSSNTMDDDDDQDDESISSSTDSTSDDDSDSNDSNDEGQWITNTDELSLHQQAIIDAILKDAQQAGIDINNLPYNQDTMHDVPSNNDNNNDDDDV